MRNHNSAIAFDIVAVVIAYLIFAISFLAIYVVKYPIIKRGFFFLLLISGILIIYNLHNYRKDLK